MATSTIKQVTNNSDNGHCKMPDGTMIAYGKTSTLTVEPNTDVDTTRSFGVTFVDTPSVTCNITGGYYSPRTELTGPNIISIEQTKFKVRVRNDYSSQIECQISWIAIGRWK